MHYKDEANAKIFELGSDSAGNKEGQHAAGSEGKGKEKATPDEAMAARDGSAQSGEAGGGAQFLSPTTVSRPVSKSPSIYSLSSAASSSTLSPSPSLYSISSATGSDSDSSLKRSPSLCFDLSRFGEKDLDSLFAQIIPDEVLQAVWEENHKVAR
jgi:hypothetical protein